MHNILITETDVNIVNRVNKVNRVNRANGVNKVNASGYKKPSWGRGRFEPQLFVFKKDICIIRVLEPPWGEGLL